MKLGKSGRSRDGREARLLAEMRVDEMDRPGYAAEVAAVDEAFSEGVHG